MLKSEKYYEKILNKVMRIGSADVLGQFTS